MSDPNLMVPLKGKSSKFSPHAQKVSLNHPVQDEDVVSSAYWFLFDVCPLTLPSFHQMK
jgi:hypothetical protein